MPRAHCSADVNAWPLGNPPSPAGYSAHARPVAVSLTAIARHDPASGSGSPSPRRSCRGQCSDALSLTVTQALVPLKVSAPPNLPEAVRVALAIVPALPLPELSAVVVPLASSKPHAPTSPLAGAPR